LQQESKMSNQHKKMAVFIANYSINNSPSILNFLSLMASHYSVDLYVRNCSLTEGLATFNPEIRVIEVGRASSWRFLLTKLRHYSNSYDSYVCFDPHGLVLCDQVFPDAKPFYYSLELYLKDDHFGLDYTAEIAERERCVVQKISGLIIQSREKELLFREDYGLPASVPAFILPVTGKGIAVHEKSDYLYNKYNISSDCKIALHLGGIAQWFSCLEIAQIFGRMDKWVLFFQGYPDHRYLVEMKHKLTEQKITNVIFTGEIFQTPDQLEPVLMSSCLGIAWYNDISLGFRTAGRSSGKIASYLKFGLPIITNTYPSMIEAIGKTGCGICIDRINQIHDAVSAIEGNYADFALNARKEYNQTYCFDSYSRDLMRFIRGSQY